MRLMQPIFLFLFSYLCVRVCVFSTNLFQFTHAMFCGHLCKNLCRMGVTCAQLKKNFGCSCSGCKCANPPVCDAKAMKKCTDAFKEPCTKGHKGQKCGKCIDGYKSNGKGDCDKDTTTTKAPEKPKDLDACGQPKTKGGCDAPSLQGDGYCDDSNNNPKCNWDGGDCFGVGNKKQLSYCEQCKCLSCAAPADGCVDKFRGQCGSKEYKGDGNCDDHNNNAACGWDGGDCCGLNVNKQYCDKVIRVLTCLSNP